MSERFAKQITYLFHPLWMPAYGVLLWAGAVYGQTGIIVWRVVGLVLACFVLLPTLGYGLLVKIGRISTPEASDRRERWQAYLLCLLSYYLGLYLLTLYPDPQASGLYLPLLGSFVALGGVAMVNVLWKISAHACGIGGLTGGTLFYCWSSQSTALPLVVGLFFVAALVCAARLRLHAHSPAQLFWGYGLGFVSTCLLPLVIMVNFQ